MRLLLILASIIFFFGCKMKEDQKNVDPNQILSKKQLIGKEKAINKEFLQGIWGENIDDNAIFWIKLDSMYFLEEQANPSPIKVSNDTLITDYGDGFITYDKIYALTNDSLVLINEFGDTPKRVKIKDF